MIASVLRLGSADCRSLRITDPYSIHRVVYSLFDDVRSEEEKRAGKPSGILYVDKGGGRHMRQILMLSNRKPRPPKYGEIQSKPIPQGFLQHDCYGFEVIVNPTRRDNSSRKLVAVKGRDEIADWFMARAEKSWGFRTAPKQLQVQHLGVQRFEKSGRTITHGSATLK
ncbi:MAG: type I-E CRISPR-associated protein Cas6/Cse3/CasE, partial [Acidobacteriota bacterium]|nr:type I-E CRISPR-associated protein Cas6/Cse3/CasE [Acidobacteriota bacterium]